MGVGGREEEGPGDFVTLRVGEEDRVMDTEAETVRVGVGWEERVREWEKESVEDRLGVRDTETLGEGEPPTPGEEVCDVEEVVDWDTGGLRECVEEREEEAQKEALLVGGEEREEEAQLEELLLEDCVRLGGMVVEKRMEGVRHEEAVNC